MRTGSVRSCAPSAAAVLALAMALTGCTSMPDPTRPPSTPPAVTALVQSLGVDVDAAKGFTGTVQQRTPGGTSEIRFRATNDGTTAAGAPAIGAMDLAQNTPGSVPQEYLVRRVEPAGPLFVGPAAQVRSLAGTAVAGSASWLRLDAGGPRPFDSQYRAALQLTDLVDPHRYLDLAARATAIAGPPATDGAATVQLTLAPTDFRASFPDVFSGVPTSPTTVTAELTYHPTTQVLQSVRITQTRAPSGATSEQTWQVTLTITSLQAVRVDPVDQDDVALPPKS